MENDAAETREPVLNLKMVQSEIEQIGLLQSFIKGQMKEGEDFGKIPGSPKPSLFKSGAEKLCSLYGYTISINVLERVENWDEGFFYYMCKCILFDRKTGSAVAEGVGSCNSREAKYSKLNPYTIVNTILKIAKKRALVDATLSATRTSNIFTQDLEDMEEILDRPKDNEHPALQMATQNQRTFISKLIKDKNISDKEILRISEIVTGKTQSKDWTKEDASNIIKALQTYQSSEESKDKQNMSYKQ